VKITCLVFAISLFEHMFDKVSVSFFELVIYRFEFCCCLITSFERKNSKFEHQRYCRVNVVQCNGRIEHCIFGNVCVTNSL